jgi:hypothetical protein
MQEEEFFFEGGVEYEKKVNYSFGSMSCSFISVECFRNRRDPHRDIYRTSDRRDSVGGPQWRYFQQQSYH